MSQDEGALKDRRASVRVPIAFDVELSDHYYRWDAKGVELSPEGCAVVLSASFGVGKELEVHFAAAWGAAPLDLSATVAHVTRGQLGLCLDVSRTENFEAMLDRVDRLQQQHPALGVYAARAVRRLVPNTVLSVSNALAAVAVSEPERRFLKQLGSGRQVGDVAQALGPEWAEMRHVPFALLQRGLIRLGSHSKEPGLAPPPPVVVRANVRPEQADKYLQNAVLMMETGDRKQARVNLHLAASLSPNDPEIESLLAQLEDK
jgi:hypothetical protein